MSNDTSSQVGYVASGLAVLAGLGVALKTLLARPDAVTRREFDELKAAVHELSQQLQQINVALAEIRGWLKPPPKS